MHRVSHSGNDLWGNPLFHWQGEIGTLNINAFVSQGFSESEEITTDQISFGGQTFMKPFKDAPFIEAAEMIRQSVIQFLAEEKAEEKRVHDYSVDLLATALKNQGVNT